MTKEKAPNFFCEKCGNEFYSSSEVKVCPLPDCGGPVFPIEKKSEISKGSGLEFTRGEKVMSMRIHQSTRDLIFELGSMRDDMEDVVIRALKLLKKQKEKRILH